MQKKIKRQGLLSKSVKLLFELSQDILLKASQIRDAHNFSFWDSIVAASALDCDANCLISEDMQSGFLLEGRLKIVNPFA